MNFSLGIKCGTGSLTIDSRLGSSMHETGLPSLSQPVLLGQIRTGNTPASSTGRDADNSQRSMSLPIMSSLECEYLGGYPPAECGNHSPHPRDILNPGSTSGTESCCSEMGTGALVQLTIMRPRTSVLCLFPRKAALAHIAMITS